MAGAPANPTPTDAGADSAASPDAASTPAPSDAGTGARPADAVLVPTATWTCGMPDGLPPPALGESVLELELQAGAVLELGRTQYGERRVLPIDGGSFSGALRGEVMNGGLDWDLSLASGAREIEGRLVLVTHDGVRIYLRTCGTGVGDSVRITADFEAPASGPYAFLHDGSYVGTREATASGLRLVIHRAAMPPDDAPRVRVPDEADATAPRQQWDCSFEAGTPADTTKVIEAPVNIGSILSLGQSKRGSRTIIPITGGSFSGPNLRGEVIAGGADYQLTPPGGSLTLEARYTLRTDDGELISVRNCGGISGTTPQFETRPDGPHGFLTTETFAGTIGLRAGGVLISVYRAR